jgi:hypothetical protein
MFQDLNDHKLNPDYNLQDYILDNYHIQKALRFKLHKMDKKNDVKRDDKINFAKKDLNTTDSKLFFPNQKDTLFWCYYIIVNGEINYETLHVKNTLTEKQMKIDLVSIIRKNKDLIKTYKFDSITNIESNLANDQNLSIKTFIALTAIANINIIYISKKTYFESFMNDSPVVYVVEEQLGASKYLKKYGFEIANEEKIDNIRKTLYKLEKIDKPIKAISGYKVEELVNMCEKLAIETKNNNGKTKSKKDLYEAIIQYL